MRKKAKARRHSGTVSKVLILALLLAALGWRLYGLRRQVAAAQAERDRYAVQVEELREENEALEEDIAEGATQEKLQQIAREELGLVGKDEYVFYNTGH